MGILNAANELDAAAKKSEKVSEHLRLAIEKWEI